MHSSPRLAVLLVLAALALALTGCGGSAEPSPMPTGSTTSVAPSPSGPAEPVLPEAAKADTKAGAAAFVKYYVALINYAQATGDVDGLRAASDPGCTSCVSSLEAIQDLYGSNGRLEGGGWRMGQSEVVRNSSGWLVTTRVVYGPQRVIKPGESVKSFKGGPHTLNFTVDVAARKVVRWTRAS